MGRRRLPEFASERELVRFLDDPNADLSVYDLKTVGDRVDVEVDEAALRLQEETEYGRAARLHPVTMRLDGNVVRALKHIAARRGISYQTLARMWLRERAIEELRTKAGYAIGTDKDSWSRGVGEQTRLEQLLAEVSAHLKEVRGLLRQAPNRQRLPGLTAKKRRRT